MLTIPTCAVSVRVASSPTVVTSTMPGHGAVRVRAVAGQSRTPVATVAEDVS